MLKIREEIKIYIKKSKEIYDNLISFLEINDDDDDFEKINKIKSISEQIENYDQLEKLLQLISNIADNCHRNESLFKNIYLIIEYFENIIKQEFSNIEIYHIFESNKKILLFLFQKGIITIDDIIYEELLFKKDPNGNCYCHFFYPEIKNFVGEKNIERIEQELLEKDSNIFDHFEEKREEGENDNYICSLIRKDSVEDFIKYINRNNVSITSLIPISIFETNSYLNKNKNPTLIEYTAFFGSIQIFQYLVLSKVELDPSLWLYAIHSRNAELIHLLESYRVMTLKFKKCFCESIKCHHNEIAEYLEEQFFPPKNGVRIIYEKEKILSSILEFHNYAFFPSIFENSNEFYYLFSNNYFILVNLFMKMKEELISQNISLDEAANQNKTEIIYYLLLNKRKISKKCFLGNQNLKKIVIPPSIISIEDKAFKNCSSLKQIYIPSSVTKIGISAFRGCSSLKQISIPSSVSSIKAKSFKKCSSLRQITIPPSIILIGYRAFENCSSLKQILIPSSVTKIENSVFRGCSSLKQISIPSSVTSMYQGVFQKCSSLKQISISSSFLENIEDIFDHIVSIEITENSLFIDRYAFDNKAYLLKQIILPRTIKYIDKFAFRSCISLTKIVIPDSVVRIEDFAFSGCSSLHIITILSPTIEFGEKVFDGVESIEICGKIKKIQDYLFYENHYLKQVIISSSVTCIGKCSFAKCSSLIDVTLPSSLNCIKNLAFYECSSIVEIEIPDSVEIIGENVFERCKSLKEISLSSSLKEVGNFLYLDCTSLEYVKFPPSIEYIGDCVVDGCTSLKTIEIPSSSDFEDIGACPGVDIKLI